MLKICDFSKTGHFVSLSRACLKNRFRALWAIFVPFQAIRPFIFLSHFGKTVDLWSKSGSKWWLKLAEMETKKGQNQNKMAENWMGKNVKPPKDVLNMHKLCERCFFAKKREICATCETCAKYVLVCITPHWLKSAHCFLRRPYAHAHVSKDSGE